jgi:lipopolysaccharide/colanic/teichoic acid biosynthesis glycosyltransferase
MEHLSDGRRGSVLSEAAFHKMIAIERKRTERSGKPFLLMLAEVRSGSPENAEKTLGAVTCALVNATRETDVMGRYKENVAGVIFTELAIAEKHSLLRAMFARVSCTLKEKLTPSQFDQMTLSFHLFPDDHDDHVQGYPTNLTLYPELSGPAGASVLSTLKRMMDIVVAIAALVVLAPLFLAIAVAIKATSKGPVLFRQERIGQYGKPFIFLKFRTMYADNDATVHEQYVKQLIAGTAQQNPSKGNGQSVYKLTNDARITRTGAFLRNISLDEIPQLLNVLKGEMSLVGPRPPIPYEVENYALWHRHRFLIARPGLTGLWQVSGRNRVKFDDMVRLDMRYAKTWSLWLDLKILLRTPLAILQGAD